MELAEPEQERQLEPAMVAESMVEALEEGSTEVQAEETAEIAIINEQTPLTTGSKKIQTSYHTITITWTKTKRHLNG